MHITMFYVGSAMTLVGAVGLLVLFRWFDLRRVLRACRADIRLHLRRRDRAGQPDVKAAGARMPGSDCVQALSGPDPVRMTQLLAAENGGAGHE